MRVKSGPYSKETNVDPIIPEPGDVNVQLNSLGSPVRINIYTSYSWEIV
jgi:hypothetical protein